LKKTDATQTAFLRVRVLSLLNVCILPLQHAKIKTAKFAAKAIVAAASANKKTACLMAFA
jgi:hypothetical protein